MGIPRQFIHLPVVLLVVLVASPAWTQSPLVETRNTVEKWVEARQLRSTLEVDWQIEKEILSQSIEAYESELTSTEAQISKVDTGRGQVEEEFDSITSEKRSLIEYMDRLKGEVSRLESKLKQLSKLLPLAVSDRISPLLDRIPEVPLETKLSISTRMQNLLGVINEVDKFNGGVSVVSELRKNQSGAEVQAQVIYVGLAQAYFVDPSGEFAGVGSPGEDGWKWSIKPELAAKIQQAIDIYQGGKPAAFVELPIELN